MKINRDVWRHINKHHSVIYHSVSGGRDSVYALLNMMEEPNLKVPIVPLFNNTHLNCKSAIKTIEKIKRISPGMSITKLCKLITLNAKDYLGGTRYSDYKPIEVLKESFKNIPKAQILLMEGTYSKKVFPCCYYLKDRPLIQFAKTTDKMALFTSSIRGGESRNRQQFLAKIRSNLDYFHFHSHLKRFVFYPLRDTNEEEVRNYLFETDFWDTRKSGCIFCPILVLFDIKQENGRYERSMRLARSILTGNDA